MGIPSSTPLGSREFREFIRSTGGLNEKLRDTFLINLSPWLAITIFHEVAHVLLNHASIMLGRFPTLAQRPHSIWTSAEYKLSRELELEADKGALDLYMNEAGFDAGRGLTGWIRWLVMRAEVISRTPGLQLLTDASESRKNEPLPW